MRRPQLTILTLIIAAFALLPSAARACQCIETATPPCARYWRAQAVLVASAVEIYPPPDEYGVYPPETLVRLSVEQVYRGKVAKEVFERQGNGANCKVVFETGRRYLLYAHEYDPKTRKITTSECSGSGELAADDQDLEYIQGLRKKKPEQNVYGKLAMNKYTPLPGIKIIAAGNGKNYTAVTDQDGEYKIALPKAGAYRVRAIIPFSASTLEYSENTPYPKVDTTESRTIIEYEMNVPAGQCRYKETDVFRVDLKAVAEIKGRVVDVEEKPVGSLTLYLYPATEGQDFYKGGYEFATTDKDGRYSFVGLRGGRFWLGVNLGRMPDVDEPYPVTYYPGVPDPAHATLVELEDGQELSLKDFRLPPKLVEREITGVVLWPDGSPVTRHTPEATDDDSAFIVTLYDPRNLMSLTRIRRDKTSTSKVDGEGRFSVTAFEGYTYVINASAFNAKDEPMRSKYVKVKATEDLKPLTLILSLPRDTRGEDLIKKELGEQP